MIRTFFCIELPGQDREQLDAIQQRLRRHGARISWVTPDNIHITLAFLGNVPPDTVPNVVDEARKVAAAIPQLHLAVSRLGAFPNLARPRTLWAGIAGNVAELATLAGRLEAALEPLGFPRSGKPFRPHATIGRVKDDRDCAMRAVVDELSSTELDLPPFCATEMVVMRSDLEPGGARYTPLARLAFSSGSAPIPV